MDEREEKPVEELQGEVKGTIAVIKSCPGCIASKKPHYQDTLYGTGMRVMNLSQGGTGKGRYRCTVCGEVV